MDDSRGANTCRLYNDGGDLKITAGKIGIDDGTVIGVCDVTAETIDMSGVSAGNWAKIELSVSGSAYTIEIADITGEISFVTIPDPVKAAYVASKRGYYLTTTKRLIGIARKAYTGDLSFIYNTENGIIGFKETEIIVTHDTSLDVSDCYLRKFQFDIGLWNMDSAQSKNVAHPFSTEFTQVRSVNVFINTDSGAGIFNLLATTNAADPDLLGGGLYIINSSNFIINRRGGGIFDNIGFDDSISRGWLVATLEV
jgi:hypothetical protein